MFTSPTYGQLNMEQIAEHILQFYRTHVQYGEAIDIIVGTDSQNFSDTKMVNVITVVCHGHGGIFFYHIHHLHRLNDVVAKLYTETEESLKITAELVQILESNPQYEELYLHCSISIHVDAGNSQSGKTRELIPQLVGWITACGYDCAVKPDSFAASSIADKISK